LSTLYIVGTPIGNLEDITQRALRVLRETPLVAAEDTRVARKLLSAYGLRARLVAYNDNNRAQRLPLLLEALQQHDVALVTDAGMPALSDPGSQLVAAAAEAGIAVQVVPGPSALTAALAVAGLPVAQFLFLGFPPSRPGPRRRLLESVVGLRYAVVLFEAPHRLRATLSDLNTVFGERALAVCRELTKRFEEVFRGTPAMALDYFIEPRGEFTLVLSALQVGVEAPGGQREGESEAREALRRLKEDGVPPSRAVAQVARRWRLPRPQVYGWWIELE